MIEELNFDEPKEEEWDQLEEWVVQGQREAVHRVLDAHPTLIFKRSDLGDTLLHYACWHEQYEIARLLLSRGADVNARGNHGYRPLHSAVDDGDEKTLPIVKLLLEHGADPRLRNDHGALPVEMADLLSAAGLGEDVGEIVRVLDEAAGRRTFEQIDAEAVRVAMAALLGCDPWELPPSTPLSEVRRRIVQRYRDVFVYAQVSNAVEQSRELPPAVSTHLPPSLGEESPADTQESQPRLTVAEWCNRACRVLNDLPAVE